MKKSGQAATFAAITLFSLSGCVVNVSDSGSGEVDGVSPPPVPMVCEAEPAQSYVGRDASQSSGEAILRVSGARTLRWGPPNAAWTMDYREDRVNVRYGKDMKVSEITCG
ncbi:I78 family peptidase inhibitor [Erythrobacter sp. R86502]|uniref:I78 family peptidase inhibitor n=1 Tax=Erythrobacter sp. R86502 TaxID=3093846 RepID=UPI0036D37BC3